jgi:ParB family chromosome partitioning protein
MSKTKEPPIKTISIDRINILNPRVRNQKIFESIAKNIKDVGLKRPITVREGSSVRGKDYDLVCGQGRMEAFIQMGRKTIPAIVIDASEEEALLKSLVENLARRQHRTMDLLQAVEILKSQGYDNKDIAAKTGLSKDYINGVLFLLEHGEQRLLAAVEAGTIPITVAVQIATSPNDDVQIALQEAYDSNLLRGKKLVEAKKMLEQRKRFGKISHGGGHGNHRHRGSAQITAHEVLKIYEKEVDRKRVLTRKANAADNAMVFITEALRRLLKDKAFKNILEAEELTNMPKPLADLCAGKSSGLQGSA